jgi:RluA family pseudouridine synthase
MRARSLSAAEIQARVLHRDGLVLVIDKPAGLPVHRPPGGRAKGGACLEDAFVHLRFGLPRPPALAHRLDRDTSGCLALGRHRKALAALSALFRENRAEKTYWALVAGHPPEAAGRVELALTRVQAHGASAHMVADPRGLPSVTEWRLLAELDGCTWIEAKPLTGRMHQIRAHLAALGCPVLGDPLYGGELTGPRDGPVQLHARRLALPLRKTKPPIEAEAPPPTHMAERLPAGTA